MMESTDNSSDAGGLSEAFLPGGNMQYTVDGGGAEDEGEEDAMPADNEPLREQDRFLPIANVAKIMKKSVPSSGKIAKDAKECVQECVSEFISFITSEASERCHREKRKTINGEDILFAMSNLGFDNYVEPLKVYLQKYRESTKGEKGVSTGQEAPLLDDLQTDDSFAGIGNLTTNILGGDQPGQQGVIYTTAFPPQITQQQLNFG